MGQAIKTSMEVLQPKYEPVRLEGWTEEQINRFKLINHLFEEKPLFLYHSIMQKQQAKMNKFEKEFAKFYVFQRSSDLLEVGIATLAVMFSLPHVVNFIRPKTIKSMNLLARYVMPVLATVSFKLSTDIHVNIAEFKHLKFISQDEFKVNLLKSAFEFQDSNRDFTISM